MTAERALTEDEFDAMEGDPRRTAGYYSGRARYFRLRAAQHRARLARGFLPDPDDDPPDAGSFDRLADALNQLAVLTMEKVERPANPTPPPR